MIARPGDVVRAIEDADIAGLSLRDVRDYFIDRVVPPTHITVSRPKSDALLPLDVEEEEKEEDDDDANLREPAVRRYRIARGYGYMQFDFKEFIEFFRAGGDIPNRTLGADWPRAVYVLSTPNPRRAGRRG